MTFEAESKGTEWDKECVRLLSSVAALFLWFFWLGGTSREVTLAAPNPNVPLQRWQHLFPSPSKLQGAFWQPRENSVVGIQGRRWTGWVRNI